ncbi:MAG: sigma-54 dependent transcriptional regulator [Bacteroidetes bacterium]|nr:sigma-54 dependent transcriptional regulator [Bacteroidota bacterium]
MQKILIIDDEVDICLLLKRFLAKKGYETEYATDAAKGLEILYSFKPDLVLSDFRLGKMDGSQILTQIKEQFPHLPVIIMTGYSDIKVAINVMKLGAFDYLTKPLFPEEILLTVQRALSAPTPEEEMAEAPAPTIAEPQKSSPRPAARRSASGRSSYIFGDSAVSRNLVKQIQLVAPTNYSVIIYGESGSGKEAVASEIHRLSSRSDKPFVAMDCGAISPQLAGSELFGHEKGAFTGALEQKIGHFELANGGTLFLDEVANLSYDVQVSLLRVIQERQLRRIGGTKTIDIDVRIIIASNERLWDASRSGKFREDLYHRFNEFSIEVPPLRERGVDIMLFSHFFLNQINEELGKNVEGFSQDVTDLFHSYPWYGNLRELKNVLKRATLLCDATQIQIRHLPFEIVNHEKLLFTEVNDRPQETYNEQPSAAYVPTETSARKTQVSLKNAAMEAESEVILNALRQTNFNKSKAAALLNIDRKTLYNKIKYYNI